MLTTATTKTYGIVERIRPEARRRLRRAVRESMARAYSPPPKLSVAEWADSFRYLSPEAAALPGRWKTSNEPMARGVMDAFSDPMVEKVTVMCAAQIMKTEAILNTVGYFVHGDPAPILIIQPTVEMAEAFSKDRVAPMIRDTPALTPLFETRSRDSSDTIRHKAFPGGRINIAGANAPAELASRPIRVVLCDEVDRYPISAGKEGDPVGLAEKRTTTFWNRKIGLFSTPTVKGHSRIEASFDEGDRRRYYVPCPHCGVRQYLRWARVKWPEGQPEAALYHCDPEAHDPFTGEFGCGEPWTEAERIEAIDGGIWIAEGEFKGHASFHASQLASKRVPLARVVREFLECKAFPDRLKAWVNTVLAETWEEGGEKADPDSLFDRREAYPASPLPAGVGLITAGVDVQDNRFECEIVGWGRHDERWSLDYIVHYADPSTPVYWEALDDVLNRVFEHPFGFTLRIDTACVDSGGHHTQAVYDFCRPRFARRVFAIKGVGGPGKPIWPKKATRNHAKKTDVFLIGVDQAKDVVMKRLMIAEPGPGFCHFPKRDAYDEAYFAGLTAEKKITKYRHGQAYAVWEKPDHARNEPFDCAVYALAAKVSSPVEVGRRLDAMEAARQHANANPEPAPKPRIEPRARRVRSSGIAA